MSYLTSNLVVDLHFWDQNTIDFTPTPKVVNNQVQGGDNFFFSTDNGYFSVGATRYSSNSKFKTELRADHAYYIHGYL